MNTPHDKSVRRYAAVALAGALLLSSNAAHAAHSYAGFGAGQSSMQTPNETLLYSSVTDQDTAWKMFMGFQFNHFFGMELARCAYRVGALRPRRRRAHHG